MTYSSSGNGTTSHLSGALLQALSGANLIHVPYRNAGQAHADVIAGRVDFTIDNLPVVLPFAQSGQLVPIAVTGPKRNPKLPDVPTMAEAGLPYEATSWFAVLLPAAVKPEIARQVEETMRRTLADPACATSGRSAASMSATAGATTWSASRRPNGRNGATSSSAPRSSCNRERRP